MKGCEKSGQSLLDAAMANTMTVKEAAMLWGVTERWVTVLCKEGRIEGAYKKDRIWLIPANAKKPADSRIKTGAYRKTKISPDLPLPVGISDYRLAASEYYYVDKTMMIRDFLDERPMVSLFTRPRRFGKTLNMDMIRTFFEKTGEDTSVYFRDKKIWACGKKYRDYQGKYPVIFITFKDVKRDTWEETYDQISKILRQEFERHSELLQSGRCSKYEKLYFKNVLEEKADNTDMMMSLQRLSQMLDEHYGIPPIIIIDEYDTPIQQGHMRGFYDKVILFMRNLFSGGLKDNRHLSYGFLTGILRVAKESIFSGLNNLKVNTILDDRYGEYFGFTSEEVKGMARYYHAEEKYEEICAWYDGYQFGDSDIFNPWSVINYFSNGCQPKAFWQSTGSNEIIGEVLAHAGEEIYERLNALLQGKSFLTYIDTGVIYPQIRNNPSSVYSFLLVAGYLKAIKADSAFGGDYMCEVALPNQEIAFVYNKEILQKLTGIIPQAAAVSIQEALYSNDAQRLQKEMHRLLLQSVSCYDTAGENFYHGFVLGLCAMMDNCYYISSNGESGEGRYDIQLLPKAENMPGILIELKAARNFSKDKLKRLSEAALAQIEERKYDTDMEAKGVKTIFKYGVAFSGKQVEITTV